MKILKMVTLQIRKCKKCGNVYTVMAGGFIFKVTPDRCPKCGNKPFWMFG